VEETGTLTDIEVLADGKYYVFKPTAPILIGRSDNSSVVLKGKTDTQLLLGC
jgi:hypothetical protein